ncbi:metal ABC transporter substrate-binding protein [Anaerolineales bacterium HSG24]|nr:metal ABC transporter substrate-binding protein [Anaerolineales bacterium HSG24]
MITEKQISILTIIMAILLIAAQCSSTPAPDNQTNYDHSQHDAQDENDHDEMGQAETELTPVELAEVELLNVVATTNIVGDIVNSVGGTHINLTTLLPLGSDPHTYQPTPQDVAAVAEADIVFINGLGLEEFLTDLIENAGGEAVVVDLSVGLPDLEEHDEHNEHEENGEAGEDHDDDMEEHGAHGETEGHDPHIWFNPINVRAMVQQVENSLAELDPQHQTQYNANLENYESELNILDQWIFNKINTLSAKRKNLVMDHNVLNHYANRYGLGQINSIIPSYSSNTSPSAQELAELQNQIIEQKIRVIFVSATANMTLAERLAEDTGIKLIPLYTGSLGEEGSGAETYLDYMRHNTQMIVNGLSGRSKSSDSAR